MRLKEYITENDNIRDEFIEQLNVNQLSILIKRNCKPYLKLLKKREPLFRAMQFYDGNIGLWKVRKNRNPKMMTNDLFKILNQYLKKRELPLRSKSMICTSDEHHTRTFGGDTFFVFPKGNFKFAMVKSNDINYSRSMWDLSELSKLAFEYLKYKDNNDLDRLYTLFDISIDGNSQKAFDEAYKNGYEMWFDCDSYYYVRLNSEYNKIHGII